PGRAANYIAKYTSKNWNRELVDADGVWKPPQYMHMSTKPPIGHGWLSKYASDVKHGYLVHDGTKRAIPRAYIKMLNKWNPQLVAEIMRKNEANRIETAAHQEYEVMRNHPDRRAAREVINKQRHDEAERRRKL